MVADIAKIEKHMQDYYEKLMDKVYLQHHTHPTHLTHHSGAEPPGGEYSQMAQQNAGNHSKKVTVHGVRDYSNGLPRKP